MPNDKDNRSDHPPNGGSSILKSLSLVSLPWLALQLDILKLIKHGLTPETGHDASAGATEGDQKNPQAAGRKRPATGTDENGSKGGDYLLIKPIEHLVEREVHALMMILDPLHTLRNRFGADFEQNIVDELTKIIDKFAAGSVNLIEVQQIILNRVIETVKKLKNEGRSKPSRQN
jgi:hypothetical protein